MPGTFFLFPSMHADYNQGMKKLFTALLCLLCAGCTQPVNTTGRLPDEDIVMPEHTDDPYTWLNASLDYFLNDGMKLPEYGKDGSPLSWSVVQGDAKIRDGCICKTEQADEYEPVTICADDGSRAYEFDQLLIDPYVGYVISYFSEKGDEAESMKLAFTYNCTYWFKLNEDHAILKAELGTKRLRDPMLFRKKDGTFGAAATQGYDTDSIYLFDSPDLITYENERLLKVSHSTDQLKMSEKQAWAPEVFYDHVSDRYVILWSSVEDGRMFFNTSSDLNHFSAPAVLKIGDDPVIDGTIVRSGHSWMICVKDEREPMEEYSQLFLGFSDDSWDAYERTSDFITGHQSEGPMFMKDLEHDGWYLFYDDYTRYQFRALHLSDTENPVITEVQDSDLLIPLDAPAHSCALPVTWKEMQRLEQAYGS